MLAEIYKSEHKADRPRRNEIFNDVEKRFKNEVDVIYLTLNFRYNYSKDKCDEIFYYYINKVNKKIYKNAFRRYGKCINHFAILDGGQEPYIRHFHVFVGKCERYESMDAFGDFLVSEWKDMREANYSKHGANFRIVDNLNKGTDYSLKNRTKEIGNGVNALCHIHHSSFFYH